MNFLAVVTIAFQHDFVLFFVDVVVVVVVYCIHLLCSDVKETSNLQSQPGGK